MRMELQQKLYGIAPLLFRYAASAPKWRIGAPDDLYPFLAGLAAAVEKFNRRYPRRRVWVMRIAVEEGVLTCDFNRRIPCVEKRVGAARRSIRSYRRQMRGEFLQRAKKMQTTALFASRLLPEWRLHMPDERATLRKILNCAERCAVSEEDWRCLAGWYRTGLRDEESARRCEDNIGSRSP